MTIRNENTERGVRGCPQYRGRGGGGFCPRDETSETHKFI